MPIINNVKRNECMNELNQNLAENLSLFLMELRDEVVKGLQDYMQQSGLALESL